MNLFDAIDVLEEIGCKVVVTKTPGLIQVDDRDCSMADVEQLAYQELQAREAAKRGAAWPKPKLA